MAVDSVNVRKHVVVLSRENRRLQQRSLKRVLSPNPRFNLKPSDWPKWIQCVQHVRHRRRVLLANNVMAY